MCERTLGQVYISCVRVQLPGEDCKLGRRLPLLVLPQQQGPSAPLANLSAPAAISATTSVHAVEQLGLPPENLSADAPGASKPQCALKGGRPLPQQSIHVP
jgi:hypothetical protein